MRGGRDDSFTVFPDGSIVKLILRTFVPLHGNFGNRGTPVKTKLHSVKFELGPIADS